MSEIKELLDLTRHLSVQAANQLVSGGNQHLSENNFSNKHPKELKSSADMVLENFILAELRKTGLPILSEESGYQEGIEETGLMFIVDPLDGTYNLIKGLGPSAISIALWDKNSPIFGVIFDLMNHESYWGGKEIGAFRDGKPITVSRETEKIRSAVCTGFPVRADLDDKVLQQNFWALVNPFAKVRMLGSAAISLLHVSSGAAEVYSESRIMLWDIAAGLAILEGAGGNFTLQETSQEWCVNVFAANGYISQ